MKKITFLISLLAFIGLTVAFPINAQEGAITQTQSVDLGVENPGILPSSPFYFFKEWGRGVNKFFTFNPVKKAELELDGINQKAAEIKKMEEIAPQNIEAITKAAANYQKNAEQLKSHLEALKETSQNPNVDKLLDKLVDRSIKHQELFDGLEKKFEDNPELKEIFKANQERMNEMMIRVPMKFEGADLFKQRMEKMIENQPEGAFKELRAVEMLDRAKEGLSREQQEKMQELKDKMIGEFEDRMEKLSEDEKMRILRPEVLERLPGDQIRRMEILKEIQEKVNPGMMEKIKQAEEGILEQKIERKEIRAEEVEKMIQEVKGLIVKLESGKLSEEFKKRLGEAEKTLSEGKIGEAFGRVTAIGSQVKNALRQNQQQTILPLPTVKPIENNTGITPGIVCAQVITPAISSDGVCKNFPTPCDVPKDWKRVEKCSESLPSATPLPALDIKQLLPVSPYSN